MAASNGLHPPMLSLLLATAVVLAPTLAPGGKSSAVKAETSACTVAPVRAASLRPTKQGLEATAFVVGLEADRGAFAVEGHGALDVVPLSERQDVRLAYFDVGAKTNQLKLSVLRPKKKSYKKAIIPDDLKEGVLTVDVDAHDNIGIELLVRRRPEGSTQVIVAVAAPEGLAQLEVRLGSKRPSKVETGARFHGTSTTKPEAAGAALKKGLYYLSFDNSNGEFAARGRWSGSTSAPWTAAGAFLVGGERCDDGAGAKKSDDGRRRYRRIKKQMISTLQTYTR